MSISTPSNTACIAKQIAECNEILLTEILTKQMVKYSNRQETDIKKEAAKAVSKTRKAESTEGGQSDKIWSNAAIAKMNTREYAKHEKDIDKAVREGRIQP